MVQPSIGRRARMLAALALLAWAGLGRQPGPGRAAASSPGDPTVEPAGAPASVAAEAPAAPASLTIETASPTCHRPAAGTAACYIEWGYIAASASSGEYVISMTVSIDDRLLASVAGFFQNSVYIPPDMFGRGFKVVCGAPGASGDPTLGASYRYRIDGRATGGPVASVTGSVSCPADIVHLRLPMLFHP